MNCLIINTLKTFKIIIYVIFIIIISLIFSTKSVAKQVHIQVAEAKTEPPWVIGDKLFNRISKCESEGGLKQKNKKSTASGEFQFLWNTWYSYGKEYWGEDFYEKNIWTQDNRELAWYVYKKYGTKDWDASKSCWSKQSVI